MRLRLIPAVCGMLFLSLGASAYGFNCYQIWDARDNLVYQSFVPPFDLARPAFDQAMANLRNMRRTFIFFDTSNCAITGSSLIGPESRSASADPASILDIRQSVVPSYGSRSSGVLSPTPASVGAAPVNVVAPQSGTSSGGSTGTSMGTTRPSGRY